MSVISRSSAPATSAQLIRLPAARDAVVAAVAFALTLGMLAHGSGATRSFDALGVVLAVIACGPLLAHRRWPLGVFAVCTGASATIEGLGYSLGPPLGPTAALFYLAADRRTPDRMGQTVATVVALGAIHVGVAATVRAGSPTIPILGAIIIWGGAWIIGDQVRQRRQRIADRRERAERSERETARERRLAVAEERNRIARDLHDSAAHAINVILVQAGGARLVQDRDPAAVRTALSTIEGLARETIDEIDRLIRGLRANGDNDGDADGAAIELPTGLASADSLAARYRDAGLAVNVYTDGGVRPLAPALDQAAYRILQESLTNAARHGTGRVDVHIGYADAHLELLVSNPIALPRDGRHNGSGYGILGMRERAGLLGGRLDAGAGRREFCVHARLPYQPFQTAAP